MSNNKKGIHQIIEHLSNAASAAASSVGSAAQRAGQYVGEKYDVVKLKIELNRLQNDQKNIFADIGRTVFLLQNGGFADDGITNVVDAQQLVDQLLLLADEKQRNIEDLTGKLTDLSGNVVCVVCGRVCDARDTYCPTCGAKLPSE